MRQFTFHPARGAVGARKEFCVEQRLYVQGIKALRQWDKATLLVVMEWWGTEGAQLCGEQAAFNAIGQIQAALKSK